MIKVKSTSLEGFLIVEPNCYKDDRGFFLETYQEDIYKAAGITEKFVQDNQSRSIKGVIRGMHFHYKVSRFYDPDDECGMIWNDSEVNIDWPSITPLINQRDATYQSLSQLIDGHQLPYNLPIEVE